MQKLILLILTPLRMIFFVIAIPVLFCTIILLFTLDNKATTKSIWPLTQVELQRAKSIVSDPLSKTRNTIHLSENDLNITSSYLLNQYISCASKITITDQQLAFTLSIPLKDNNFGNYVNIGFKLAKQQGYPDIHTLQIGKIIIADEFAGLIIESIIKYTPLKDYYILAVKHIKNIQINIDGLAITYNPSPDLNLALRLNLEKNNYQSVLFYQQLISQIIAKHDPKWRLSLSDLLQPLFESAYKRSTGKTAKAENRAVLIAVSTYVNKHEIESYLPFDISPATNQQYPASLYKRTDMAKHFIASAVLAATGGKALATILGQEKELNDAKQGSGFSFIDLASNKAGLYFGKMAATRSKNKARRLQLAMSKIKDYSAFMPDVRDLPENLSEKDFKRDFESIYSVKYQNMLKAIDQRISALIIYRKRLKTKD
ncbi:MAG: hypothetical protein HFP81_08740 [Methylococcales symbiont of Hymedesmia sp. n. MRB-2018]|nr:MAG: hypothetical protein HFP81_08740 [Methylococcales symbiont of Hymedesmia sp. n. MRB-2018]